MGGKLRRGNTHISGVVSTLVKNEILEMVSAGKFETLSQAIGTLLAEAVRARKAKEDENEKTGGSGRRVNLRATFRRLVSRHERDFGTTSVLAERGESVAK